MISKIILAVILLLLLPGCSKDLTPEQEQYYQSIEEVRQNKDKYMKSDSLSPFNQDSRAEFRRLKYFDIDTNFVFNSRLFEYPEKDTIIILSTKGDERNTIKEGYVIFYYKGEEYKINIYKGVSRSGEEYHSIWFTDRTTGEQTYGVGRYIDFEYVADPDHIYTIDFNLAYNPYCAYSSKYNCAIPTKEDHLDLLITAGEKNFH
jgi:uncharacterized protein